MADMIKVPLPSKPKPEKPGCECSVRRHIAMAGYDRLFRR